MEARATAKYIHRSPRKLKLVVDAVRGKKVDEALAILRFLPQGGAKEVLNVVRSAAANAENNFQMAPEDLYVKYIYADSGPVLKRFRARSRGMASPILKRSCHITVVVEEQEY